MVKACYFEDYLFFFQFQRNEELWKFAITLSIHFMSLVSFYAPRKHQKFRSFLMHSGGIQRDQWYEMG